MPIPQPHSGEQQKDFISRCMGNDVMVADYSDQKQRAAVCYSTWERRNKVDSMKLYGSIEKVEPLDDGTVRVHGIASTEAVDDQGEIVRAAAMRAAIPDYMRFPAIREMHQLQAAGTALEAEVGDDGITRVVAHVIDPVAVMKVKNNVYRAFSIGGRVTKREPGNPKVITGILWNELSLVDRPANPEAVFDCWKLGDKVMADGLVTLGDTEAGKKLATLLTPPVQIWKCGISEHSHEMKAEALKCIEQQSTQKADEVETVMRTAELALQGGQAALDAEVLITQRQPLDLLAEKAADKPYGDVKYADPGYQSDGKKRYPIDTEGHIRAAWNYINKPKNAGKYSSKEVSSIKSRIVSAWKDKIDSNGPPSAKVQKAIWNLGNLAMILHMLDEYCEQLEQEREVEGDDSPQPDKLRAILSDLAAFTRDQAAEDTSEVEAGTEADEDEMNDPQGGWGMPMTMMSAALSSSLVKDTLPLTVLEVLVESTEKVGRRHGAVDQAHLDTIAYALGKAAELGAPKIELGHIMTARKAVLDAGATEIGADGREMLTDGNPMRGSPTQNSTVDTGRNSSTAAPNPTGAVPGPGGMGPGMGTARKTTDTGALAMIDAMVKANKGNQALLDVSHDLMCAVTDGAVCKADSPRPTRHSGDTMTLLGKAHEACCAAGGKCAVNALPGGDPAAGSDEENQGATSSAKAIEVENLAKALDEEKLSKVQMTETLTKAVGMIEKLSARVEQIANTPMPSNLVQRRTSNDSVSKSADDMLDESRINPNTVAEVFANMTSEEQTLTLVKASRLKPIKIASLSNAVEQRAMLKNAR